MQTIALIDYGSGNLHSAERALVAAAGLSERPSAVQVTDDPDQIGTCDRVVLPGVGHFADCMEQLSARDGVVEALQRRVMDQGVPFLGICVGLQLLAEIGREDGETRGLGWVKGQVKEIPHAPGLRIPHMGWNEIELVQTTHPVFRGLGDTPHMYFVHSFQFEVADPNVQAARVSYGAPLTAAIATGNLFGTQFHPEKSQGAGLKLLANWLEWSP